MAHFLVFSLLLLTGRWCYAQRIIGGSDAEIEQYPSMVQVEYYDNTHGWGTGCGGSILNELYILSAAHCFHPGTVDNYSPDTTRIRAGATRRTSGGVVVSIITEINHPSYLTPGKDLDGDITVVRLASPLSFGPTIQQARIPSQNSVIPDDVSVMLTGWGAIDSWTAPTVLQHAQVYTINNEVCREWYQSPHSVLVTPNMICAGLFGVGGRSYCFGDSGSPLFWNDVTIGVASWVVSCGEPANPSVATAVASYTDWIVKISDQRPQNLVPR